MRNLVKFFGNESVKLVGNQGFCIRIDAEEERDEIGRISMGESYYLRLENATITRTLDKEQQIVTFHIVSDNDLKVRIVYLPDSHKAFISILWSDTYELKYGSDYALPSYDKRVMSNAGHYVILHHSHTFKNVESISLEFAE